MASLGSLIQIDGKKVLTGEKPMSKYMVGFVLVFGIIVSQGVPANAQRSVLGYWKTGGLGTINEVNTTTGQTKNRRGQMFSYRFAADGSYTFHGYMESTMFGCTTSLFERVTGRYIVDAGAIFLKPSRDVWTNSYSCFPNRNSSQEKPTPAEKSLQFRFKTDEYGKSFICLNDAGVETCYRREEE
jgi:hypothetical protein